MSDIYPKVKERDGVHLLVFVAEREGAIDSREEGAEEAARDGLATKVRRAVLFLGSEHLSEHGEVDADKFLAEVDTLSIENDLVQEDDGVIPKKDIKRRQRHKIAHKSNAEEKNSKKENINKNKRLLSSRGNVGTMEERLDLLDHDDAHRRVLLEEQRKIVRAYSRFNKKMAYNIEERIPLEAIERSMSPSLLMRTLKRSCSCSGFSAKSSKMHFRTMFLKWTIVSRLPFYIMTLISS